MSESVDIVQSFHQLWLALRDFATLRLSMFSTTLDRLLGHIGLGSHKGKVSKGLLIRIGNRLFLDGKGQKTERDVKKVAKEEMSREERRQKRKEERLARKQSAGASTSTQNTSSQNTAPATPAALPTADVSGLFDELKRLRQELTKLSETTTGAGGAASAMPRAGNAAPPPPPPPPMPSSASGPSSSGVRGVGGPSVAGTARPAAEHAPAGMPAFLSEIKAGVGAEKLRRVSMMKPAPGQQQGQQQQQLGARARQHQNPVSPGDVLTMALKKKFQNANKRESMEAEAAAPKESAAAAAVDPATNNENSENNTNLPTTPQKVSTPSKLLNVSSNVTLRNSPRGSPLVHTPVRTNHTAADDNDDEWK